MAERNYRRDDNIRQTGRYAYIDGSTVRKLQTRPVPEKRETERRQEQPRRRKRTSAKTRRNRARALQIVDLETIRNIAINKLGMVYAGEEQVKTYDDKSSDYVRQYSDVPTE